MPVDPAHEFPDVLQQLCGQGGGLHSRWLLSAHCRQRLRSLLCAERVVEAIQPEILRCFSPSQLPVLNALAREFAVCDNWFAPMPGPTWPNRFFMHAASSNGLDHSPDNRGDRSLGDVGRLPLSRRLDLRVDGPSQGHLASLYAGDDFPMVAALKGIQFVAGPPVSRNPGRMFPSENYGVAYTFIEPSYNVLSDYKCSTSQHPLDDVTRGEALIRATYQAVRNSPQWEKSLIVITWDEHGGFYDHVAPPAAIAPGDNDSASDHNQSGFTFQRYGGRVPAVAISPWIPRNLVDHRVHDHTSILATVENLFGMPALTRRDAAANNLTALLTLAGPRNDAPLELPQPAISGVPGCPPVDFTDAAVPDSAPPPVARPDDPVNDGNVAGVLHSALRGDLASSPAAARSKILAQFSLPIKTCADARQYADAVRSKLRAARAWDPRQPGDAHEKTAMWRIPSLHQLLVTR